MHMESSLIELVISPFELESSLIELESCTIEIKIKLSNWIRELFNLTYPIQ